MQLQEAVKRVMFRSHRGNQAAIGPNDQTTVDLVTCFNLALADMATLVPRQAFMQSTTFTTVQGTEIYPVTTSLGYPIQQFLAPPHYLFNGTNYNLKKIESVVEFWTQYFVFNAAQNRPYIYVHWGLDASKNPQIRLFPIPDGGNYTINVDYELDPTATILTTANLSTELPLYQPYLQKAWVTGAYAYFLDSFDDPKAPMIMTEFKQACIDQDAAEEDDIAGTLQFRIDTGRTRFVDPATGIRLQ